MSEKQSPFAVRRSAMAAVAEDIAVIGNELSAFALRLQDHARAVEREVEAMERAEQRFRARAETTKAAHHRRS